MLRPLHSAVALCRQSVHLCHASARLCCAVLCRYRIMPNGVFNDMTDMVTGWEECIAELERRRAKTNTPDMKLVISMSFGGAMSAFGGTDPIAQALSKLATKRPDVMWLAAAGNEYKSGNQENCPACYPDVIAVAAVDATATVADYSNRGAYVDIAAPGEAWLRMHISLRPGLPSCIELKTTQFSAASTTPLPPPSTDLHGLANKRPTCTLELSWYNRRHSAAATCNIWLVSPLAISSLLLAPTALCTCVCTPTSTSYAFL